MREKKGKMGEVHTSSGLKNRRKLPACRGPIKWAQEITIS
jgi:hypothetical protein